MKMNNFSRLFHNLPAKLLSLAVAIILFWFIKTMSLEEVWFSIPLEVQMNEGFLPSETYRKTVRVNLRGASESLYSLSEEDISAIADFSGYNTEGTFRVPIIVEISGGAQEIDDLEIIVEPLDLNLKQEVLTSQSYDIEPVFSGYPASGYQLDSYFFTPSAVTVIGPRSKVLGLSGLFTESINLLGKREDFTERVRIVQDDPLIEIPGGDVVEIQGSISEIVSVKTFSNLDVVFVDLNSNLVVSPPLPKVEIIVQGTQNTLENLLPEAFKLFVNCSDISEAGEYEISLQPTIPEGVNLLKLNPLILSIKIDLLSQEETE